MIDVDGNRYWDFHNGFGSMVQGHAHPAIVAALRERAAFGTHFAAVTEDTVLVAEELARRFGLERWRLVNSGSEATMDAIRIARALTGRETIVKIFGSYHGHHDAVMVSIGVPYEEYRRPRRSSRRCPTALVSPARSATSPSRSRSTTQQRWSDGSSAWSPKSARQRA